MNKKRKKVNILNDVTRHKWWFSGDRKTVFVLQAQILSYLLTASVSVVGWFLTGGIHVCVRNEGNMIALNMHTFRYWRRSLNHQSEGSAWRMQFVSDVLCLSWSNLRCHRRSCQVVLVLISKEQETTHHMPKKKKKLGKSDLRITLGSGISLAGRNSILLYSGLSFLDLIWLILAQSL